METWFVRVWLGMARKGEAVEHIDSLSTCADIGKTKNGDKWSVKSYYDTNSARANAEYGWIVGAGYGD